MIIMQPGKILCLHPYFGSSRYEPIRSLLEEHSSIVRSAVGDQLFQRGQQCRHFLLLVSGTIRVFKNTQGGRELTLYRISGGESCALTTACMLSGSPYPASGVAESSALSLAINQDSFFKAITQFPDFRAFIFEGYGEQIGKILSVVSELAFERLNARLAQTLLSNARDTNTVNMTHQEIAAEVGSVREVVSRELQHFRRNGWVDLGRGRIVILDRKALSNQALSALAVS